jgi:hypothetical protein
MDKEMARKRHKKPARTPNPPAPIQREEPGLPDSELETGIDFSDEDDVIRILMESETLAYEPEFIDLTFNQQIASRVSERWFQKYDTRLEKAQRKSEEEFQEVYEEVIEKIIAELATPPFRDEVLNRISMLAERLSLNKDFEKLRYVETLGSVMESLAIPWHIYALIIVIYNRTIDQGLKLHNDYEKYIQELSALIEAEGEESDDLSSVMASPEKLDRYNEKLFAKNPDLQEIVSKKIEEMMLAFQQAVFSGEVILDIFTKDELLLPVRRFETEFGQTIDQVEATEEIQKRIFEFIQQAISDVLTPERFRRFHEELTLIANDWMHRNDPWAAFLLAEISILQEEDVAENPFVLAVYMSQLNRMIRATNKSGKKRKR